MFYDRKDAGEKLAKALEKYKDRDDVVVLAIPRGGVEVGLEVAKYLRSDFSMIICRKLPYLDNPESGFGAICEDGSLFINPYAPYVPSEDEIYKILLSQKKEIERRVKILRKNRPLPDLKNKIVILVDDGIAMGSTMRAAIDCVKNKGAKKVVVAAPVAGRRSIDYFSKLADDVVVLESPANFYAVAQVYANWYDVSDEEVLELLNKYGYNNFS